MTWNKPKQLIQKTLLIVASISFLVSIIAISVFYIWFYYPKTIDDVDKNIPNYYQVKIDSLHAQAKNSKSANDKYSFYTKISDELKEITNLHKFYDLKTESNKFIIDYLVDNNQLDNAVIVAKEWQENYPYDFHAKYKYIEVLKKQDETQALNYLQILYNKHKDLQTVSSDYASLLLKLGHFDKALEVAINEKNYYRDNSKNNFRFYYIDKQHKAFSKNANIVINAHKQKDNHYFVTLNKKFNAFAGLRLDIDRIKIGSRINNISLEINTPQIHLKNIKIDYLNHLEFVNGYYKVTGRDPFFVFEIPKSILGSKEELEITAKLQIENKSDITLNKITDNKNWRVSFSNSKEFEKKNSSHFELKRNSTSFHAEINTQKNSYNFVKISLPHITNFKFNNLSLNINNTLKLSTKNIFKISDLKSTNEGEFLVTGLNPYIIYQIKDNLVFENINIKNNLGRKQ
jgi:hypothetical protein